MDTQITKETVSRGLSFLDLGFKYLLLTENVLNESIKCNNSYVVMRYNEVTDEDYFDSTKWSDFNIFPILFNLYHGIELIMKGLILITEDIKLDHSLSRLLETIKKSQRYETELVDVLEKFTDVNKVHPYIQEFMLTNFLSIDTLYASLRYPDNKKSPNGYSYTKLKYKSRTAIPCFENIVADSKEIRKRACGYFSQYRSILLS